MGQRINHAPSEFREHTLHDFSIFGFHRQMRQMERHFQQLALRGGEPVVSAIEGAVYVPADESGLMRRWREAIASSFSEPSTVDPESELDEEVVYLGWLFAHYGHFLMQLMARTWFLTEVDPSVRVVFHHSGREHRQPASWALRILDVFGIPPDRSLTWMRPRACAGSSSPSRSSSREPSPTTIPWVLMWRWRGHIRRWRSGWLAMPLRRRSPSISVAGSSRLPNARSLTRANWRGCCGPTGSASRTRKP